MIIGLGTDIVENERIREIFNRRGTRFLKRIYTDEEIEYSLAHSDPIPYLAARFAVKEAAIKAFNLGKSEGLRLKEVAVAGKVFGKKKLIFCGRALEIADKMGAKNYHISLAHTKQSSMAVVILER